MRFLILVAIIGAVSCQKVLMSSDKVTMTFKAGTNPETSKPVVIRLFRDEAPIAVENFIRLCERKENGYVGTKFHRVVRGFVVQGGDAGGKSAFYDDGRHFGKEDNTLQFYGAGWLSMAKTNVPISMADQFFFSTGCDRNLASLNKNFTVFGKVASGMDAVNEMECMQLQDEPKTQCRSGVVYEIASCRHDAQTVNNVTTTSALGNIGCSSGSDAIMADLCESVKKAGTLCMDREGRECYTDFDRKQYNACVERVQKSRQQQQATTQATATTT
uniref:Peptidyl-prolyl cis-trans isomerase n=1 Tax=Ciona savignyi TaxID=51511 RepID=H2Y435_CIOSA